MANLRTFYACQAVGIGAREPDATGNYPTITRPVKYMHGIQSVGINSTFDVENVFELGQLEIYDSVLNIPQVEITIEKALDGYVTPYSYISSGQALATASKFRADAHFVVYADTGNAANGGGLFNILCTGMYVNNVTYTFPVEGNCTESITLVGNIKKLGTASMAGVPASVSNGSDPADDGPPDTANYATGSGRMVRRQDVTVTAPGSAKAQSVTLTLNLGREDVFEFGQRIPYAKIATYPIEVTAEIQSLLTENNDDDAEFDDSTVFLPVRDQSITVTAGNVTVNLGSGCYLSAINQTGGDATGGNATISRSFTTYNFFSVTDSNYIT